MKVWWSILLVCLVACGSGSSERNPLADLDRAMAAPMVEVVDLDSIGVYGVTDFAWKGSDLWLLFQYPGSKDVLARYDLTSGSCVGVIKRGRGPRELITATPLDDNGAIAVADCNLNRVAIADRDTVCFRQLPAGGLVSCLVRGRKVVSTGLYFEGRYRLAAFGSERTACFGAYPQGDSEIDAELLPTAYVNSRLAMKPDSSRFVCVNSNCGILEINAISEDSIVRVAQVAYHYPDVVGNRSGNMAVAAIRKSNINGFFDVACTDDRIYALYSGRSYDEAGLNIENCDFLIAFDWSGNFVGALHLSPALRTICIDRESGMLYGLAYTDTRSVIYNVDPMRIDQSGMRRP